MTSYQKTVLDEVSKLVKKAGHKAMFEHQFSNVGTLLAGSPSHIVFTMSFNFQAGGKNMILFNGAKHGPATADRFYFSATETDQYQRMIARVKELLA